MQKRRIIQYDRITNEPIRVYDSIREAQEEHHCTHISCVCAGFRASDGGYIWGYEDGGPPHRRSTIFKSSRHGRPAASSFR